MRELTELDLSALHPDILRELPTDHIELIKMNEALLATANDVKDRMVNEVF